MDGPSRTETGRRVNRERFLRRVVADVSRRWLERPSGRSPDDPPAEPSKMARNGAPNPPKLIIFLIGTPTESGGLPIREIQPPAGPPLGLPNRASI